MPPTFPAPLLHLLCNRGLPTPLCLCGVPLLSLHAAWALHSAHPHHSHTLPFHTKGGIKGVVHIPLPFMHAPCLVSCLPGYMWPFAYSPSCAHGKWGRGAHGNWGGGVCVCTPICTPCTHSPFACKGTNGAHVCPPPILCMQPTEHMGRGGGTHTRGGGGFKGGGGGGMYRGGA